MKSKANVMVLKQVENQGNNNESKLDWLKWLISIVLILAGLVVNHYYSDVSMLLRVGAWLLLFAAAGLVASRTRKGKLAVEFVRESKAELRKVIWPTREETMQTTLVVAAMVIVLAIILWGMDGVLVWLIGWLTGQRG